MFSLNVATSPVKQFVYVSLKLLTARMDLIKSGLGMNKHKQSQILNPTNILMAQIADHFMNDLQIDVEKRKQNNEKAEQMKIENDKQTLGKILSQVSVTEETKKAKLESKCNQLLLELVETERKYVEDLEEVNN